MKDILIRMDQWLKLQAPQRVFNKGAKQTDIKKAETKLGITLPEELKDYLAIFNGEKDSSNGIIGNWQMLELKYILKETLRLNKLFAENAKINKVANKDNANSGYVKDIWWHKGWIPIVSSGSGHYFCIDTEPGKKGTIGQVILFLHDRSERYLVADNLKSWLTQIVMDMEQGLYQLITDADGYQHFNNEAFMWSSREGKDIYGNYPKA